MKKNQIEREFRKQLDLFCFFHLGSDVQVEILHQGKTLQISVAHHRVESFQFIVSYLRLEELLQDSSQLERFLLDEILSHRR